MAGGQGERLYPLTASKPKPAVPFGGVFRIVDFTLSNCLNSGLSRTSLLTQYKHEALQAYIDQSWSRLWNKMTREPLMCLPPNEGNLYRGTADAVFQNIPTLRKGQPKFVLILSGDQVYQMDYRELLRHHAETHADLTIATVEHPLTAAKHFGVVEVDTEHRVVGFQEKPPTPRSVPSRPDGALISMGVYAFKTEMLLQVLSQNCDREKRYDFGHHIIPSLIGAAHIRAYEFRDKAKGVPRYWRDIGTLDTYHDASMDLVRTETPSDLWANADWPFYPRYETPSHFGSIYGRTLSGLPSQPLASLRTNCRVKRSILSPSVRIEDGGVIESSVLMSQVSVGKNTRIRNAIIEEGVHIPAGFEIGFDPENDRKHYFVTDAGIVVVSHTPKNSRPILVCVQRQMRRSKPFKSSRAA